MKLSQEFIREMIRATISEEQLGLGFDEPKAPPADEISRQIVAALEKMSAELEGMENQVMDMGEVLRGVSPELAGNEMNINVAIRQMIEDIDEVLKGMQNDEA